MNYEKKKMKSGKKSGIGSKHNLVVNLYIIKNY